MPARPNPAFRIRKPSEKEEPNAIQHQVAELSKTVVELHAQVASVRKAHLCDLYTAKDEIQTLRRTIETLRPLAQAFEAVCAVLKLSSPKGGGCETVDTLWQLNRNISELEATISDNKKANANNG